MFKNNSTSADFCDKQTGWNCLENEMYTFGKEDISFSQEFLLLTPLYTRKDNTFPTPKKHCLNKINENLSKTFTTIQFTIPITSSPKI